MDPLIAWFCQFMMSPRMKEGLKQQMLIPLWKYEARVRELDIGVEDLKKKRAAVQHRVEEEENRYGRRITDEVKKWIEGVDKIISECEDFHGDEHCKLAEFDLFTSGYLPKLGIRYHLSTKAYDITRKINGLSQMAKHDTLSYWFGPPSMAAFFSIVGYESFPSRDEIKKKIMAALKNPNVRMIGLHGLSGVGKTSLAKKVAKEALKDKMFNVVVMANVTRNADIRKIQGQIADMLGMKLDEESDIARAARIQKRLKNEKESTLIILDDLWDKLDFNMLGIPSENDDEGGLKNVKEEKPHGAHNTMKTETSSEKPKTEEAFNMMKSENILDSTDVVKIEDTLSHYKGWKMLLISETKQVLSSQMEGKENFIFFVDVLMEKEAQALFKKKARIGDTDSVFEKLAAQIANKCQGLPMSIVTTARALKNQSRSVWEDVNRKLEWQKLTGAPEFSTKLSYELLENEELKFTFLLCARMGPDALIMDLIKYCIGLGFLQGVYTVREARDRVYVLVGKLKESGLLSDSYSNDYFTMQEIVRSAALSIASKEEHVFTMTKGKVDEWPEEDKLKRYTAISLQHCDIIEGFPLRINCPRLRVFHVSNNGPHLKIPSHFFKGMKELKVLILTGFYLSPLPSSITCLTKLRMLCLEHCMVGVDLSIIGELKKLRVLSFSGSNIERLPTELKQLIKLQILDISNCSKLRVIPSNVIQYLISLEELYMRRTSIQWNNEGEISQSENASLSELRHLNQLTTLDIEIPNVDYLSDNLFFDKLYSYKIVIGDLKAYLETDFKMPEKYEASRFLAVQLDNGFDIHSQNGVKLLFDRVENLLLEDLNGVQDIFYRLNLKGFPYLKHLSIVSNSDIQSLINPEKRKNSIEKAFPKLESLYLYNLKNMKEICSCELSTPSFGKLKVIKIYLCNQLENVFSISVVRLLTVLETLEISKCKSLKKIVPVQIPSANKIEGLEFPELRSLMLQSLPQFITIQPYSSTGGETRELFHDKIVVSKLERMELSSIHIDIICREDQPSLNLYFQNLIHLDVNDCWNLKHLLSFSMAKSLVNLQSLLVSECEKMKHIFSQTQGSHAKIEGNYEPSQGSIFPNLKNIKLSNMKSLTEIWNAQLPSDSFGKLDTLIIEQCDRLNNVFPSNVEGKIFRSLCNLRVTNCRSMEEIFDQDAEKVDAKDVNNLQDVHLEALPKLQRVWKRNKDQRVLNLKKLQKIRVQHCHKLEYIFPIFEAKCLEYLMACDCFELRDIVVKGNGTSANTSNSNPPFVFPKLTTIKFSKLPRLRSFYSGDYELRCEVLSDLSIELCDKFEPFKNETQRKRVLFPEKVINNLKAMQIESWHAKSSSSYMSEGNHRWDNLEELHLSRLMNTDVLYSFLHRNANLKSLSLSDCLFKEMVPCRKPPQIKNLGVVPQLKSLKLIDLPNLEEIGFQQDKVLQRIEFLILKKCPSLVTIVHFSVSLAHLTYLEVVDCKGLQYLMTPSSAESLTQLSTMKVLKCESLKEIVSKQGNEGENAGKVDIVFRQLKTLELVSLKSLESFCSSNSCIFEFPVLEKLVVSACPKMKKFSEVAINAPILQKIYVAHEQEKRWCWDGNLRETIQKMFNEKRFLEGMKEMSFAEKAWHDGVGLQKNCQIEPSVITSNLPYLKGLKELEARDCDKSFLEGMEEIVPEYSMKALLRNNCQIKPSPITSNLPILKRRDCDKGLLEGMEEMSFMDQTWYDGIGLQSNWFYSLKTLKLNNCQIEPYAIPSNLPYLKSLKEFEVRDCYKVNAIFDMNNTEIVRIASQLEKLSLERLRELTCVWENYGQGILSFQNLQQVFVSQCDNLKTLFPATLTKKLKKLAKLEIKTCNSLAEIVGNKEEEEPAQVTEEFVFPSLTSLDLYDLKMLTYFYPETFTLKCPALLHISVLECPMLKLFQTAHPKGEFKGESSNSQPLFSDLKAISNLEKLELDWKHISVLMSSTGELTEDLKYLNDLFLYFDFDNNNGNGEGTQCRINIESMLEKAPNIESMLISYCRDPKILFTQNHERLGHVKNLTLYRVNEIKSIGSENSPWLNTLHKLHVFHCSDLTTLVLSAVTFSYLRELYVSGCDGLEYLFTSSQAKKLMHLEEITVKECGLMKQIVLHDETNSEGVKLEWLDRIILHDLLNLVCFYSGNNSFQLPSLLQMDIIGCPNMETFSKGPTHVESFRGILASENSNDDLVFHDTLNKTVKILYVRQDRLFLGSSPLLQEIWRKSEPVQEWYFNKSTSLNVEDYDEFSSDAILPSHLLPFLSTLEELKVRRCNSVKAIFDHMGPSTVSFFNLTTLIVDCCGGLEYLFTSSTAKSLPLLKELIVGSCKSINQIVAKEGDEPDEDKMNFDQLEILSLYSLPKFEGFCPGSSTLNLPSLKEVSLTRCHSMEYLFTSSTAKSFSVLKKIRVADCESIKEIVSKEESEDEEETKFAQLEILYLSSLQELRSFYSGSSTLNFPSLKEVSVSRCHSMKYLFTSSTAKSLSVLKEISVADCESIEEIVSQEESEDDQEMKFEQLEIFTLFSLQELRSFYSGSSTLNFPSLKEARFTGCHNMEYLFTSSTAKRLPNLKEMHIINCKSIKEIMAKEGDEIEEEIKLEKLEILDLESLPEIGSFYSGSSTLNFPSLKKVRITECHSMKYLFTSFTAERLPTLREMRVQDCKSIKEIVVKVGDELDQDLVKFEKLEILILRSLPELGCFYSGSSTLNFPSMKHVSLTQCYRMKYLFISSTATTLPVLNNMRVSGCESIKEIVAKEGDEMKFKQLQILTLSSVPELENSYSWSSTLNFPKLKQVSFTRCNSIKGFFDGAIVAEEFEAIKGWFRQREAYITSY